jgi:predicted nicotinamide N-methyase
MANLDSAGRCGLVVETMDEARAAPPAELQRRIRVGEVSLQVSGPGWPEERPEERILLWWGLTTSALALAEDLIARDLRGLRVLELGCGLGLAGIAAGRAGAAVTLSDLSEDALAYAGANAAANGLPRARCATRSLDWVAPPADLQGGYELVIGSELLYDYTSHGPLLRLLPRLLAPGGRVLLVDRPRLVVDRFLGRLRDRGFRGSATRRRLALPDAPERAPQEVVLWDWAPEVAVGAAPVPTPGAPPLAR